MHSFVHMVDDAFINKYIYINNCSNTPWPGISIENIVGVVVKIYFDINSIEIACGWYCVIFFSPKYCTENPEAICDKCGNYLLRIA